MLTWDDVVEIGCRLPEVEAGTWFGTPGLKVAGKGFCRLRSNPDALVIRVLDLGDREALLQGQPGCSSPRRTTTGGRMCWSGSRRRIMSC